jgi:hypothetical protein
MLVKSTFAMAFMSALIVTSVAAQGTQPPSRLDYVMLGNPSPVNFNPTNQRTPGHAVVRIIVDMSAYKQVADYVAEIRASDRSLVDGDKYQVIGLTQIVGWEQGDRPCALMISAKNLENTAEGLVGPAPFDGTKFLNCGGKSPGSEARTPFLAEDEFITGLQVCQKFRALADDNNRFKGLRLHVRKVLLDGPATERSHLSADRVVAGFKRPRCAGDWDIRLWLDCPDGSIAVGMDIFFAPAPADKPARINTLRPVCAALVSKQRLHRDAGK